MLPRAVPCSKDTRSSSTKEVVAVAAVTCCGCSLPGLQVASLKVFSMFLGPGGSSGCCALHVAPAAAAGAAVLVASAGITLLELKSLASAAELCQAIGLL